MDRTHDEIKGLIATYVLGAVPEDEIALVRAHILECDECMAEAESLSRVASSLPLSVDPVKLPAGFEERVMARVAAEKPEAVAPAEIPRSRLALMPVLLGAAVFAAIAVLVAALIGSNNLLSRERTVIAALLQSDSGMSLSGHGASARMIPSDGGGIFVAAGLDAAPEAHVYQVWLMDDACVDGAPECKPVSAGTFNVDDGLGLLETDKSLDDFKAVAVTIELGDGSDEPTTDPILRSS